MDALEFLKEQSRMCKSYIGCDGCPLERGNCGFSTSTPVKAYERIVTTIEQWSKEHPRKTRQSVFLEQYPNAESDYKGILIIDPCDLDKTIHGKDKDCYNGSCDDCRCKFWMQEVE